MNENIIPEKWKKTLECHNVHFRFCVKSYEHTVRVKPKVNSQLSPF